MSSLIAFSTRLGSGFVAVNSVDSFLEIVTRQAFRKHEDLYRSMTALLILFLKSADDCGRMDSWAGKLSVARNGEMGKQQIGAYVVLVDYVSEGLEKRSLIEWFSMWHDQAGTSTLSEL